MQANRSRAILDVLRQSQGQFVPGLHIVNTVYGQVDGLTKVTAHPNWKTCKALMLLLRRKGFGIECSGRGRYGCSYRIAL